MPDENVIDACRMMPHRALAVRCLSCKHKWAAVCDLNTDTTALECPNCHATRSIHHEH